MMMLNPLLACSIISSLMKWTDFLVRVMLWGPVAMMARMEVI